MAKRSDMDHERSDAERNDADRNDADQNEPSTDPEHELVGDERMYTGEPVETDEGVRRPQQMAVGKDRVEGGGEFPDPETPPRAPAPGAVNT